VLVVDDHALFRRSLRTLLEEAGRHAVTEAADGRQAIQAVRETMPDVVLMDLNMPGLGGVDATREIMRLAPLTRVVIVTVSDRDEDVMQAIVAGACGYVLKDASVDEVLRAISAAAAGESLLSPYIAGKLLQRVRAATEPPPPLEPGDAHLTPRELEILRLVASGKDNAQIAAALSISAKTVKNHVSSIFAKLHIQNRIQAAVYAVRTGLA
jgi:NarL family two-component system response regulator LiaR